MSLEKYSIRVNYRLKKIHFGLKSWCLSGKKGELSNQGQAKYLLIVNKLNSSRFINSTIQQYS